MPSRLTPVALAVALLLGACSKSDQRVYPRQYPDLQPKMGFDAVLGSILRDPQHAKKGVEATFTRFAKKEDVTLHDMLGGDTWKASTYTVKLPSDPVEAAKIVAEKERQSAEEASKLGESSLSLKADVLAHQRTTLHAYPDTTFEVVDFSFFQGELLYVEFVFADGGKKVHSELKDQLARKFGDKYEPRAWDNRTAIEWSICGQDVNVTLGEWDNFGRVFMGIYKGVDQDKCKSAPKL